MGNFLITLNFLIRLMDGDGGLAGRRIGQRDVACWGWVGSRVRGGIGLGSVFLRMPSYFLGLHCISYKGKSFFVKIRIRMTTSLFPRGLRVFLFLKKRIEHTCSA